MYAAENGHLECLEYAHRNGCKLNGQTILRAALNGHLDCLEYAHKNGCNMKTHVHMLLRMVIWIVYNMHIKMVANWINRQLCALQKMVI